MTDIQVMRSGLDAEAARDRVACLPDCTDARVERRIFYPYFRYGVSGRVRWMFGQRALDFECVVDGRNGRAATADRIVVERRSVRDGECIRLATSESEARHAAQRYASHALGKALRTIGNFELSLDPRGIVHRPYWIVRTGSVSVLVDAVTGDLHPLPETEVPASAVD